MAPRHVDCAQCGYAGSSEDVVERLAVCPDCGAIVPRASAVFASVARFHYRSRLYGPLERVAALGRPPLLRDAAGSPIAEVRARWLSARRVAAHAAGALILAALLLACAARLPDLMEPWFVAPFAFLLALGIVIGPPTAITAMLAPGPDLRVIAIGADPDVLLRVWPVRDGWTSSELAVEDGDGARLGTLRLYRVREAFLFLGHRRPIVEIDDGALRVHGTRRSRIAAGLVFRDAGGSPVATYGCNAGLGQRDALETREPSPIDRRLLVAAMLVVRP